MVEIYESITTKVYISGSGNCQTDRQQVQNIWKIEERPRPGTQLTVTKKQLTNALHLTPYALQLTKCIISNPKSTADYTLQTVIMDG
ncbi:unnamed protein product [Haemonchus placei]|uniref:Uncharacterized protein n=1 Tax=Haemonchus placei TaxID=6290 RepID=A0A0N4WLM3_HAEPC|nr:unnamed protein product [Haemonchus placei]